MTRFEATSRQLIVDQYFDLRATLNGTQDFRWRPWQDDWCSGVLSGNLLHIRQVKGGVEYRADSDLGDLLQSYFRLDEDIAAIRADLAHSDENLAGLMEKYPYLRVLRQPDPWECLVAYICSVKNTVKRTGVHVESVAELGHEVNLEGETRHAFPTPREILAAGEAQLGALELGLDRHSKIIEAAERIRDGKLDLGHLSQPDVCYAEAKRRLKGCRGVGDKVADSIALFALDKMEAFPVDRWVARAVARNYFPHQESPSGDDLVMWAQDRFGEYAGYANQLLFLDERRLGSMTAQVG